MTDRQIETHEKVQLVIEVVIPDPDDDIFNTVIHARRDRDSGWQVGWGDDELFVYDEDIDGFIRLFTEMKARVKAL